MIRSNYLILDKPFPNIAKAVECPLEHLEYNLHHAALMALKGVRAKSERAFEDCFLRLHNRLTRTVTSVEKEELKKVLLEILNPPMALQEPVILINKKTPAEPVFFISNTSCSFLSGKRTITRKNRPKILAKIQKNTGFVEKFKTCSYLQKITINPLIREKREYIHKKFVSFQEDTTSSTSLKIKTLISSLEKLMMPTRWSTKLHGDLVIYLFGNALLHHFNLPTIPYEAGIKFSTKISVTP